MQGKKQKHKYMRLLAGLCGALVLVLGALPLTAFAEEEAPASQSTPVSSSVPGEESLPDSQSTSAVQSLSAEPDSLSEQAPEEEAAASESLPEQEQTAAQITLTFFDQAGAQLSQILLEENTLLDPAQIPDGGPGFAGWYEKETAQAIKAAQAQYETDWQAYVDSTAQWDGTGDGPQPPSPVDLNAFGPAADLTQPVTANAQLQAVGLPVALAPAIAPAALTEYPVYTRADLKAAIEAINQGQELVILLKQDIDVHDAAETLTVQGNFIMVPDGGTTLRETYVARRHLIFDTSVRDIVIDFSGVTLEGRAAGGTGNGTGGGLEIVGGGTAYLNGGTVAHCRKIVTGGAVLVKGGTHLVMSGGTIRDNLRASLVGGGGVYVDNSSFTLTGGLIRGNRNDGGSTYGTTYGGGVYVTGPNSVFTMTGGTIQDNFGYSGGGGIYAEGGRVDISGGLIQNNRSNESPGVHGSGLYVKNGTLHVWGDARISGNNRGGIETENSEFVMSGGTVSHNNAGGVRVNRFTASAAQDFLMTGGVISYNDSSGSFPNGTTNGVAGGLDLFGGNARIESPAQIVHNVSNTNSGGGIDVNNGTHLVLNGGLIADNRDGGAIQGNGINTVIEINGGKIQNNYSDGYAGAIFVNYFAKIIMNGGELTGNTGEWKGGAIYLSEDTSMELNGGLLQGNRSAKGGGIFMTGAQLFMTGGTISGNTAFATDVPLSGQGGGLFLYESLRSAPATFVMSGGTLENNRAEQVGGGVYMTDQVAMQATGGTIQNNRAVLDGGGVFTENYENLSTAPGLQMAGNVADNGGYYMPEGDGLADVYSRKIQSRAFTAPFSKGYNNMDINYSRADGHFTLQFYQQNLDGGYPAAPTETLEVPGAYKTAADFTLKTYPGFTCQTGKTTYESTGKPAQSGALPIATDDSLLIKVYYDRNAYTVTYRPGAYGSFGESRHTALYGAPTPAFSGAVSGRSGYSFSGWSPQVASVVTGDQVYTAQWAALPPPSSTVPSSSSVVPSSSSSSSSASRTSSSSTVPPSSSSTAPSSSSASASSAAPPASSPSGGEGSTSTVIRSEPLEDVTIADGGVPFGSFTSKGSWGLVNLMLAVVSVVLVAVNSVRWLLVRRSVRYTGQGVPVQSGRINTLLGLLRTVSIVCGLMVLVAFLVLENLRLPMAVVNGNTPLILLFSLLQPLALAFAAWVKRSRDQAEAQLIRERDKDLFDWVDENKE